LAVTAYERRHSAVETTINSVLGLAA
jgi:hypothetical protein